MQAASQQLPLRFWLYRVKPEPMKLKEVMAALAAAGSEQTRKTYARHGVTRQMYGVSCAALEKLRKSIKIDHELAQQLWKTGIHDAQVLATMIDDPSQTSAVSLTRWVGDADDPLLCAFVSKFASKTSSAAACFEEWSQSDNDWTSATGWTVLAELAGSDSELSDAFFQKQLKTIEQHIHTAKNRTRYAMNSALIGIGIRNPALQKQALAAAARIGKVEVDHGDTSCKTPDAIAYIKKAAARKKK
jgi:3-methyladenine DNA glycosylase AlkD